MLSGSPAMRRSLTRPGFTLLEVLVTVGIIAIIAGLSLVGILAAKRSAVTIRTKSDLALIGTALEAYKTDFGDYPRFDQDNTTDSLNVQSDRGARLLCRALLGPGPATGNAGFVVGNNEQGPDGADGPGFRLRLGGKGKVWGPYIDSGKFKLGNPGAPSAMWDSKYFTDATLLDQFGNPILYYPATPTATTTIANGFVVSQQPSGTATPPTPPFYNAFDNASYGTAGTYIFLAPTHMAYLLGDTSVNGQIDPGETATTSLPYLLWTAGADGQYGFGYTDGTRGTATPLAIGLKSDDVCNFDLPANMKK